MPTVEMEYIETPLGRVPTLKSIKMLAVMVDNISNEITRLKTQLASSVISEESLKSRINEIERAVGELADAIKNIPREVPRIREKNEIEIEIEQFVDIKEHFGRIIGQKTAKKLLKHARAGMCVLVRGPAGSGKTLLIRAFAKEKKLDLLTLPASLFDPALVNEYIPLENLVIFIDNLEYATPTIIGNIISLLDNKKRKAIVAITSTSDFPKKLVLRANMLITLERPSRDEIELFLKQENISSLDVNDLLGLTYGEILAVARGVLSPSDLLSISVDPQLAIDSDLYKVATSALTKLIENRPLEPVEEYLLERYPSLKRNPHVAFKKLRAIREKMKKLKRAIAREVWQ